jgi:hypothetical protein
MGLTKFAILYLYAFNLISCPAISIEYERVFPDPKRTIIPKRNKLSEYVIKAYEYLKA